MFSFSFSCLFNSSLHAYCVYQIHIFKYLSINVSISNICGAVRSHAHRTVNARERALATRLQLQYLDLLFILFYFFSLSSSSPSFNLINLQVNAAQGNGDNIYVDAHSQSHQNQKHVHKSVRFVSFICPCF